MTPSRNSLDLPEWQSAEEALREVLRTAGLHSKTLVETGVRQKRLEDFYHDREPLLVTEMDAIARALGFTWKLVPLAPKGSA